ncbi:MAG: hypothetical protein ACREDO_00515 [Methyloceanibacter sp.]
MSVSPEVVLLDRGAQVTVTLSGENLERITAADVVWRGQRARGITTALGRVQRGTRTVLIKADRTVPVGEYQLRLASGRQPIAMLKGGVRVTVGSGRGIRSGPTLGDRGESSGGRGTEAPPPESRHQGAPEGGGAPATTAPELPGERCFGAFGRECANCTGSNCEVNAGSWELDECCWAKKVEGSEAPCGGPPPVGIPGTPQEWPVCYNEWYKAFQRSSQGHDWMRQVDTNTLNATGQVAFDEYCAPQGTVVLGGDEQYCCSGSATPVNPGSGSSWGAPPSPERRCD